MDANNSVSSVVVSDIKTDGSYVVPLNEFIRNKIIEDGGSVEIALLHNLLGNSRTPPDQTRIIIVPTEAGLEKVFMAGKLKRKKFEPGANLTITDVLRGVFDLTDGSVPSKWDTELITFHNNLNHPLKLRLDGTRRKIIAVQVNPKIAEIAVLHFRRREHLGVVIYFAYIDGLLLTSDLRKKIV